MPKNNMPRVLVGQPLVFRPTPSEREAMERLVESSEDIRNLSEAMRVACRMLLASRGIQTAEDTAS
jgi:Arc/MetJ-type ribon-helix-helix transcriptional regulator